MTNPNITLIAALLDRSGSMQAIAGDTCGGFDAHIARQRGRPGITRVTLAQFDDQYEIVYRDRDIADVPPLSLEPRGCTALLDSVGRFVTELGAELAALPEDERPGDVTVLVMTDGLENASSEWTLQAVRDLIAGQETVYSWDFVFLGANMDAVEVGSRMGFAPGSSLTYDASPDGVLGAWDAVGRREDRRQAMRLAGPGLAERVAFDDHDRRAAGGQRD